MAQDRAQSRQSLYREAEQVAEAVDGAVAQAQIDDLQQQLVERQAEVKALETRLKHAIEITPDKQQRVRHRRPGRRGQPERGPTAVAVMMGPRRTRGVATLGRATLEAGKHAGPLLEVLDKAVRPEVKQGTADEIFLAADPS